MNLARSILAVYVVLFFVVLYSPIAVLVGLSFNAGRTPTQWEGFSIRWFEAVFADERYTTPFVSSLWIAMLTTMLSVALGSLAGIAVARRPPGRFSFAWDALILMPLIIPEIIEALSIQLFYQVVGIPNGVVATVIGHTVFSVSFVALIVRARMGDLGRAYEEASMILGANRVQTFVRVLLPLAAPAIIAGAFLAFASSWDDVVKSQFTTSVDSRTLPLGVFAAAARGRISPLLNALAVVMVIISLSAAVMRTVAERRIGRTGEETAA